jgi:protein-disulfide isomerase
MTRFATDTAAASLATSEGLAKRLGVTGTPSFFIGGRHVVGAQPYETFRDTIDERLVAARALVAGGVRPRDVYAAMTAGGAERVVANKDDGACGGDDCNDGPDEPTVTEGKVESVPIAGAPTRGPARASITIVSFGDFECPFSAKAEAILRAVEVAHPGEVRVVFKNLPLPMHPNARLAAAAALAADEQGRFWEFHDRLYARTGTPLDREALLQIATDVGLNTARLSHDLDDPGLAARLDRDKADAEMLGVKGTPTFFVNGRRIVGAQPVTTFEAAIAKGTKG